MTTARHVASIAVAAMLAAPVSAQRPADIVRWSAAAAPAPVRPGGSITLEITAAIQEGWHLYALTQPKGGPNPLQIALATGSPFAVDAKGIRAPQPDVIKDENFDLETRQYERAVTFKVPVRAGRDATPGRHTLTFEITFQACGNGICLRPYTAKLPVEVTVGAPAGRTGQP